MPVLEIIGAPHSNYVRTVRMAAEEKGVSYNLTPCPPHCPESDAIHPFGKIPSMRMGDIEIFECLGIVTYIDAAFDGPPLHPDNVVELARMYQWISTFNEVYVQTMIRGYALEYIFPKGENGEPRRGNIDSAIGKIHHQLEVMEIGLWDRRFLAGGNFSLADMFAAPVLSMVGKMPEGESLLSGAPNVRAWMDKIGKRESFVKTEPPRPST